MSQSSESPPSKSDFDTPFGRYCEISKQHFLEHVLPRLQYGLKPAQVIEIIKDASASSSPKNLTETGRWRGFAKDPALLGHSILQAFSPLQSVVQAIVEASSLQLSHRIPTLHFENNTGPITDYQRRLDTTLPDALFLAGNERVWAHIAACGEYKKENTPYHVKDNVLKVTHSMASCIRQDPRRRFVFGFTIENCDMKLWYCDRRNILASQPFNFITDHLTLVHFFLSVLYAEPHQLGWDDTMKLLPDGINYDITVPSGEQKRTYRTQKLLADRGSRYVNGKATRVWRAVLIEDGHEKGPPVALKDCWVVPSRTREGEILRQIRKDVLTSSPDDQKLAECLLPAAEWDGDVVTDSGEPDHTMVIPERTSPVHDVTEQGDCTSSKAVIQGFYVHYRLVLSPASDKPVEHESSAVMIYKTLADATAALQLLHNAGWLHRDISTGNITLDDKGARLIDFELAKRASEEDDLTIGTVYFKAFEVVKGRYIFRPSPERSPSPPCVSHEPQLQEIDDADSLNVPPAAAPEEIPEGETSKARLRDKIPLVIPVRYNPLHDLESLWWVAVYFLLKKELQDPPEPSETGENQVWDRERQRVYAEDAFSNRGIRFSIIFTINFYRHALEVIHPSMYPVLGELNKLRRALVERYTEVEKDPRFIPLDCAKGLYDTFIDGFSKIAQNQRMRDIKLRPLAPPPPPIQGVAVPLFETPEASPQDNKEEAKKVGKPRRRRKNSIVVPAVHRYNLRPRLARK